jgi:hypothetical protein
MCFTRTELTRAERVIRQIRDPFFPLDEYERLSRSMTTAWQTQISVASRQAIALARRFTKPELNDVGKLMSVFRRQVHGSSLTRLYRSDINANLTSTYHRGKREVNAEHTKQTKSIAKDDLTIQVTDGISEFESINALSEQVIIAAGDFWDSQLQDSIKKEMSSWFDGELTTDELSGKLKELINTRLENENRSTLGDNYFRQLAHHSVVRTRTVSKFARAKELGGTGYKLINPMDERTSAICRALVKRGTVYSLSEVQGVVDDLLTSRTTADLKEKQPFIKDISEVDNGRIPFPPITWGECRTGIRIVFT